MGWFAKCSVTQLCPPHGRDDRDLSTLRGAHRPHPRGCAVLDPCPSRVWLQKGLSRPVSWRSVDPDAKRTWPLPRLLRTGLGRWVPLEEVTTAACLLDTVASLLCAW